MSKLQARNEAIIHAPVNDIWSVITDISLLPKVNPAVISATGRMNRQGETRTCEIVNGSRKGTVLERLAEMEPLKRTVWILESDSMGMSSMLHDTRFIFLLEKIDEGTTRVVNETWYEPAGFFARIMNGLMLKKTIRKAQQQILSNIKSLTTQ